MKTFVCIHSQNLLERSGLAVSRGVPSPAKMPWIYLSPADRFIKELGFIQLEDKAKRIIVWKVDAPHKRKEFCGSIVGVAGSFITTFFTFSGLGFLCLT